MKRFLFILGFLPGLLYAQNYTNICNPGTLVYYSGYSGVYSTVKCDSSSATVQGDTTFYSFRTIRDSQCMDTNYGSLLGLRNIIMHDGWILCYNKSGDTVYFKTQAALGESWRMTALPGKAFLSASIISKQFTNILGVYDSVKTITIQAKDSVGQNIAHIQNGKQFILSKHFGFTQLQDLYDFPGTVKEFSLIGRSDPLIGKPEPEWTDIFDFQAGDIFQRLNTSDGGSHSFNYTWWIMHNILSRSFDTLHNKIIYQAARCELIKSQWYVGYPFYNYYNDTISLVYNLDSLNSIYWFGQEPGELSKSGGTSNSVADKISLYYFGSPSHLAKSVNTVYYQRTNNCWYWDDPYGNMFYNYAGGLGEVKHNTSPITWVWPHQDFNLVYYKKSGGDSWGAPVAADCDGLNPKVTYSADTLYLAADSGSTATINMQVISKVSWNITRHTGSWDSLSPPYSGTGSANLHFFAKSANNTKQPRFTSYYIETDKQYTFIVCQRARSSWNICSPGIFIYDGKWGLATIKSDSLKASGSGDTTFYSYYSIRNTNPCADTSGGGLLGPLTMKLKNGWVWCFNHNHDTVFIKTQAFPGENWKFLNLGGGDYLSATLISSDTATILGTVDSVKTIRLQAKNNAGQDISHGQNGNLLILSKSHGFTQIQDLYRMPEGYFEYNLTGRSAPPQGQQELSWKDVYDFNPGDEFQTIESSTNMGPGSYSYAWYTIQKILSRAFNSTINTMYYTASRCQLKMTAFHSGYPYYTFIQDTVTLTYDFDSLATNYWFGKQPTQLVHPSVLATGNADQLSWTRVATSGRMAKNCVSYYYSRGNGNCWSHQYWAHSYSYAAGLGLFQYETANNIFPIESSALVYFKKQDGEIWGNPLADDCNGIKPTITFVPDTVYLAADSGSTGTLEVNAFKYLQWQVSANSIPSWIVLSQAYGTGSNQIIITSKSRNKDVFPKFASLVIHTDADYTFTVCQRAINYGIQENTEPVFKLYPNPSRREVKLLLTDPKPGVKYRIRLFDSSGKEVLIREFEGNSCFFGPFPAGQYLLVVYDNKGKSLGNATVEFNP